MCKPCTCIINIPIMINRVEFHSIVINKHEMDLKYMHWHPRLANALHGRFFKKIIEM
jgi:hypothetical protein